jgi:transforming growth factor-beta-induced protein
MKLYTVLIATAVLNLSGCVNCENVVSAAVVSNSEMKEFRDIDMEEDRILQSRRNIVSTIQREDDLSTLVLAATNTSAATALSGAGPLTLFAPTNDAFEWLDSDLVEKLLTPNFKKHLENLLLYHAVPGSKIESSDIPQGNTVLTMANDEKLTVINSHGRVRLQYPSGNGSFKRVSFNRFDLEASNGIVHVVNCVLLPSFVFTTITGKAASLRSFSTLVELIGIGFPKGLPKGDLTVFAPTNDAFAALGTSTLNAVKANRTLLAGILANHVVSGVIPSNLVTNGAKLKSLGGLQITASVSKGSIKVNGASVIVADVLAINGIIHGINQVLLAPTPPSRPRPVRSPTKLR